MKLTCYPSFLRNSYRSILPPWASYLTNNLVVLKSPQTTISLCLSHQNCHNSSCLYLLWAAGSPAQPLLDAGVHPTLEACLKHVWLGKTKGSPSRSHFEVEPAWYHQLLITAAIKRGPWCMFALVSMIAGAEANIVMLNYGKYSGVYDRSSSPRFKTKKREEPRKNGLSWTCYTKCQVQQS